MGVRVGTGVGYGDWVGRGGGIPVHPASCKAEGPDSEAGPGGPLQGSGVGGQDLQRARAPGPPLPAVGPASLSWVSPRAIPASGPIRARYEVNSSKVSQKDEVSLKYVEKACHSPCFQNTLRKSPLEILRFPLLAAFSPKELMVLF